MLNNTTEMTTMMTNREILAAQGFARNSDFELMVAEADARERYNAFRTGDVGPDVEAAQAAWEKANDALYDYQVSMGLGTTVRRSKPRGA